MIYPNRYNIETFTNKLNDIGPRIKLAYEFKNDNSLTFQYILFLNKKDELKFTVHYNTNNKKGYIYYFSNQSDKIKRGILLAFF